MSDFLRDTINNSLLNQEDSTTTVSVSLRLPQSLSNELDELSLTLDRSKTYLITKYIEAGIKETNAILAEKCSPIELETSSNVDRNELVLPKAFMLNTNYNNDPQSHFDMLKNQEAAAFCSGWKEYIERLNEGDQVYLYQSGVGFVAKGTVTGGLIKSEYYGVTDDKYAKKLNNFTVGFKAISAREFKALTDEGSNFRRTMVELSPNQAYKLSAEIDQRVAAKKAI